MSLNVGVGFSGEDRLHDGVALFVEIGQVEHEFAGVLTQREARAEAEAPIGVGTARGRALFPEEATAQRNFGVVQCPEIFQAAANRPAVFGFGGGVGFAVERIDPFLALRLIAEARPVGPADIKRGIEAIVPAIERADRPVERKGLLHIALFGGRGSSILRHLYAVGVPGGDAVGNVPGLSAAPRPGQIDGCAESQLIVGRPERAEGGVKPIKLFGLVALPIAALHVVGRLVRIYLHLRIICATYARVMVGFQETYYRLSPIGDGRGVERLGVGDDTVRHSLVFCIQDGGDGVVAVGSVDVEVEGDPDRKAGGEVHGKGRRNGVDGSALGKFQAGQQVGLDYLMDVAARIGGDRVGGTKLGEALCYKNGIVAGEGLEGGGVDFLAGALVEGGVKALGKVVGFLDVDGEDGILFLDEEGIDGTGIVETAAVVLIFPDGEFAVVGGVAVDLRAGSVDHGHFGMFELGESGRIPGSSGGIVGHGGERSSQPQRAGPRSGRQRGGKNSRWTKAGILWRSRLDELALRSGMADRKGDRPARGVDGDLHRRRMEHGLRPEPGHPTHFCRTFSHDKEGYTLSQHPRNQIGVWEGKSRKSEVEI